MEVKCLIYLFSLNAVIVFSLEGGTKNRAKTEYFEVEDSSRPKNKGLDAIELDDQSFPIVSTREDLRKEQDHPPSTRTVVDDVPCLFECGGSAYTSCTVTEQQDCVLKLAKNVLSDFTAGSTYGFQVWIRDANTFIEEALEAGMDPSIARDALLQFLKKQTKAGSIDDWVNIEQELKGKNTVETDQETSLVQAFHKYVKQTGDVDVLQEMVNGTDNKKLSVLRRLEKAFEYLKRHRVSDEHGLLYGATTVDWGDVQAKGDGEIILMGPGTHRAIDIYDNAMMVLALGDYADLCEITGDAARAHKYKKEASAWKERTRKVLWDVKHQKWKPHVYFREPKEKTQDDSIWSLGLWRWITVHLANFLLSDTGKQVGGRRAKFGSPFPAKFNEDEIYYHGGTTVAMLAGLNSREEAREAYHRMKANADKAGGHNGLTVGLSVYPPYPKGFFPMAPYWYQNSGDWPWFGGRTVQALLKVGLIDEAREALTPMVARTLRDRGFFEWYNASNQPKGSSRFHGGAGALATAIRNLRAAESKNVAELIEKHHAFIRRE